MTKKYYIDTCALLEKENTVEILRNGQENEINIPITVINELDNLKKNKEKRANATQAIYNIYKNKEHINFITDNEKLINNDDRILKSVNKNGILVTNDLVLRLKAYIAGIQSEKFKESIPFLNANKKYTGFINVDNDNLIENCFYIKDGKLNIYHKGICKTINYEHEIWKIKPKDIYQNASLELLNNNNIKLVSIQSKAGTGKSFLSLASGLNQVFEKKNYKKLVIIKPPTESSESIGYLPGNVNEKMEVHWRPLYKLLLKLHNNRQINKAFINPDDFWPELNPRHVEFMPINYVRGDNIDNSFVIVSESQNISRHDLKTILTRMGENCKVIIEGDISQIDNPICTSENNGLNWLTKIMKNHKYYGHITMNSKKTRGIICDMVHERGL